MNFRMGKLSKGKLKWRFTTLQHLGTGNESNNREHTSKNRQDDDQDPIIFSWTNSPRIVIFLARIFSLAMVFAGVLRKWKLVGTYHQH